MRDAVPYVHPLGGAPRFTYKIMDYQDGDTAGIKSADILIEGENAYGFLKGENGVHRLVRISPFDASGRRQTSFSAVEVVPDIPDTSADFEIKPDDYEMQVYRSSGAGGQHINKTSSAVRLIHKATGIVVACQTERSQLQNKENCLRMLRSKLVEIKEREHLEKISDIKGVQQKIEWGSQIRSYVFMPYTLAKDTRTGFEREHQRSHGRRSRRLHQRLSVCSRHRRVGRQQGRQYVKNLPKNEVFRQSKNPTAQRGVLFCFLEDYDGRADRNVIVDPVDVALLHTDAAVRYRVAAAEVVFLVRLRRAQTGMERIAGVGVEAHDRTNGYTCSWSSLP